MQLRFSADFRPFKSLISVQQRSRNRAVYPVFIQPDSPAAFDHRHASMFDIQVQIRVSSQTPEALTHCMNVGADIVFIQLPFHKGYVMIC